MATDSTRYDVPFRAPVMPYFPDEYERQAMDQFSNILRLYFNQLDNAIRKANSTDKADAQSWFMG
jgi:hypothetical protein